MKAPDMRSATIKVVWLLVLAAVPFYLFPSAARWPGLLFLPAAGLLGWWALRRPLPLTPLNPAVLLLLTMTLASAWVTPDLPASLPKLAGMTIGAAAFFATAGYSQNGKGFTGSLAVFVLFGVLMGVVGLVGMFWSSGLFGKVTILQPVIPLFPVLITGLPGAERGIHPNEVAGAMTWVVLPALGWFLSILLDQRRGSPSFPRSPSGRIVLAVTVFAAFIVLLATLILTQSRSAYIGLLVAGAFCVLFSFAGRARRVVLALAGGTCTAFAILLAPLWPAIRWLVTEANPGVIDPFLATQTFLARFTIWSYGLSMFRDAPLTGIGMNNFGPLAYFYFDLPCGQKNCFVGHAHNEFIQAGLDLGAPGLIALIALHLGAFWMLLSLYRGAGNSYRSGFSLRCLVLGFGGGLLAHLLFGTVDAVALGAKPGILFWMLLGLISGLFHQTLCVRDGYAN